MQTLMTSLIIFLAVAYLLAKWLPQNIKMHMQATLSKMSPALGLFLSSKKSILGATCHNTCTSCNGCADTTLKPNLSNQSKSIRLIRNLKF